MDRFERHLKGKLKRTWTGISGGHLDGWWFHLSRETNLLRKSYVQKYTEFG